MKFVKLMILTLGSLSLIGLGACSSGSNASKSNETANQPAATATTAPVAATAPGESKAQEPHKEDGHSHKEGEGHGDKNGGHGMGGQVVETGEYHLEFLTHKADNGVSLDFMIGKGEAHTPVTTATVTAQLQLPDGTQQALDMKYDAGEKVYKAILPKAIAGEYNVAILSDIEGKKMNSRFSFKQ
ncbi:hypothetical protein [Leptolyngbya sp. NIES-2104]|uniref:hypothetical protein n=1 Tax=Leptolyngbya sp. NIES-2104 TaxID=1552121 RepID=UPI0006ECB9AE|nr:hypothetical protein [Leptolyngbya sp. NIES-2104]GAP99772.1 hypothetical protein NIES2104_63380 [Leptolyngbya sp. NIES-2104]